MHWILPGRITGIHTPDSVRTVPVCRQWQQLKQYAEARGMLLFGDISIYVAHDSADVWTIESSSP